MNGSNNRGYLAQPQQYRGHEDYYNDRGEPLYDGTSLSVGGTPNFRIRSGEVNTTSTGNVASSMDPALVSDMLLDLIVQRARLIQEAIVKTIVGVVAAVIYTISLFMSILKIFPRMRIPGVLTKTAVWRWISKVPLVVWFIMASVSASLLPLLVPSMQQINIYANLVIGALMLLYVIRTWSACSRYLLAIAAAYQIGVAVVQLKILGFTTVTSQGVVWNLIYWNALIVYVLSIVDHFIVLPQCQ